MIDYVIYGKIIIDDIVVAGSRVRSVLGGGGPQAAFGARVWSDSVGFLSRSGNDLNATHIDALRGLDVDLAGWQQFSDIPTPRTLMQYDEKEYQTGGLLTSRDDWTRLLDKALTLPPSFRSPRAIHLVTELPREPMVAAALDLRRQGTIVSLEPLAITYSALDWDKMLALFAAVDVVTPDWPTASGLAAADDPKQVIKNWSRFGSRVVAVRHGAGGSYVWSRDSDEAWHIPSVPTSVVDPTGAGNAYGGGLCVGWTATEDARLAGSYGAISASMLVQQIGFPHVSTTLRHEAEHLLDQTAAAARRL